MGNTPVDGCNWERKIKWLTDDADQTDQRSSVRSVLSVCY